MVDMIVLYGEAKTNKAVQVEQQQTVQNNSIEQQKRQFKLRQNTK